LLQLLYSVDKTDDASIALIVTKIIVFCQ